MADVKVLFCKHWWRVCYRRFGAAGLRQGKRKALRREMRRTAMVVLEFLQVKEA